MGMTKHTHTSILFVWLDDELAGTDSGWELIDSDPFTPTGPITSATAADQLHNWLSRTSDPGDYRCDITDAAGFVLATAEHVGHPGDADHQEATR